MNIANRISIARIVLIPFFIASLIYARTDLAFLIFFIAVLSDGVDGYIARRWKQKTRLGTILDPIADKLLLVSAFICLATLKDIPAAVRIPPYVVIVTISRDALIVLGSIIIYIMNGDLRVMPTPIGKITTFFQMATIISVLLRFEYAPLVWNCAVGLTVLSGADYIVRGSRLLNNNNFRNKETDV
ncbi:MAG: CDP-alcohol phosphatidyltransferase family protein [Candidatus Omnitrophota bacterium]